jgi:hypothetical protein
MQRFAVSAAILLAFAILAEQLVGWASLLYPWLFIGNPLPVIAPVLLIAGSYLVRALRICRYFGFARDFGLCLRLLLKHNALLNLLPLRAGEAAFPVLMHRYFDVPMQRSLPALLWLRLIDLHALVLALLVTVGAASRSSLVMAAAAAWLLLPWSSLLWPRTADAPDEQAPRPVRVLRSLVAAMPSSAGRLTEDWFLTAANWLLKLLAFAWVLQLFAVNGYGSSLVGAVSGELAAILPISGLAGFGTYEAGVVLGMQTVGVSAENALTGAVNLHFVSLGTSLVAAALAQLIPLKARVKVGCRTTSRGARTW